MRILFISRTYPPVVGGIEKQNYEISRSLSELCDVDLVVNTKGKRYLPIFIIHVLISSVFKLPRCDVVVLGDGVLGIVGYLFKIFSNKPVVGIIHGLDLTYRNPLYQKLWINIFVKRLDKLIAVGNETIRQGVLRGIPRSKFYFVPNGVSLKKALPDYSRKDLEKLLGREIKGGVLLTLGRLVKRKGVAWFIEEVIPALKKDLVYIVAGEGKEKKSIIALIHKYNLQNRVLILGSVTGKQKELLYCTADLFIQPNIEVEGDIEGFGLTVLEAASYGLPVIASELEGLRDAINSGENGILIESGDNSRFREEIEELLENDEKRKQLGINAKKYVEKNFSWESISRKYLGVLEEVVKSNNGQ